MPCDRLMNKDNLKIYSNFDFRPVKVIRFISEETIEEGIYSIAQEKLKLEQDLTSSNQDDEASEDKVDKKAAKRDVSRLLKIALDVDMTEEKIGDEDVGKVYTEL